ncbi:hypothetical protein TWF696_003248 [Orbilia brochopaga]|uniref:Uncharacterized protein n=1 Tax=Orbilia brochopaga TaxID=3140254 RepID=A0AAV9U113_9PEZI
MQLYYRFEKRASGMLILFATSTFARVSAIGVSTGLGSPAQHYQATTTPTIGVSVPHTLSDPGRVLLKSLDPNAISQYQRREECSEKCRRGEPDTARVGEDGVVNSNGCAGICCSCGAGCEAETSIELGTEAEQQLSNDATQTSTYRIGTTQIPSIGDGRCEDTRQHDSVNAASDPEAPYQGSQDIDEQEDPESIWFPDVEYLENRPINRPGPRSSENGNDADVLRLALERGEDSAGEDDDTGIANDHELELLIDEPRELGGYKLEDSERDLDCLHSPEDLYKFLLSSSADHDRSGTPPENANPDATTQPLLVDTESRSDDHWLTVLECSTLDALPAATSLDLEHIDIDILDRIERELSQRCYVLGSQNGVVILVCEDPRFQRAYACREALCQNIVCRIVDRVVNADGTIDGSFFDSVPSSNRGTDAIPPSLSRRAPLLSAASGCSSSEENKRLILRRDTMANRVDAVESWQLVYETTADRDISTLAHPDSTNTAVVGTQHSKRATTPHLICLTGLAAKEDYETFYRLPRPMTFSRFEKRIQQCRNRCECTEDSGGQATLKCGSLRYPDAIPTRLKVCTRACFCQLHRTDDQRPGAAAGFAGRPYEHIRGKDSYGLGDTSSSDAGPKDRTLRVKDLLNTAPDEAGSQYSCSSTADRCPVPGTAEPYYVEGPGPKIDDDRYLKMNLNWGATFNSPRLYRRGRETAAGPEADHDTVLTRTGLLRKRVDGVPKLAGGMTSSQFKARYPSQPEQCVNDGHGRGHEHAHAHASALAKRVNLASGPGTGAKPQAELICDTSSDDFYNGLLTSGSPVPQNWPDWTTIYYYARDRCYRICECMQRKRGGLNNWTLYCPRETESALPVYFMDRTFCARVCRCILPVQVPESTKAGAIDPVASNPKVGLPPISGYELSRIADRGRRRAAYEQRGYYNADGRHGYEHHDRADWAKERSPYPIRIKYTKEPYYVEGPDDSQHFHAIASAREGFALPTGFMHASAGLYRRDLADLEEEGIAIAPRRLGKRNPWQPHALLVCDKGYSEVKKMLREKGIAFGLSGGYFLRLRANCREYCFCRRVGIEYVIECDRPKMEAAGRYRRFIDSMLERCHTFHCECVERPPQTGPSEGAAAAPAVGDGKINLPSLNSLFSQGIIPDPRGSIGVAGVRPNVHGTGITRVSVVGVEEPYFIEGPSRADESRPSFVDSQLLRDAFLVRGSTLGKRGEGEPTETFGKRGKHYKYTWLHTDIICDKSYSEVYPHGDNLRDGRYLRQSQQFYYMHLIRCREKCRCEYSPPKFHAHISCYNDVKNADASIRLGRPMACRRYCHCSAFFADDPAAAGDSNGLLWENGLSGLFSYDVGNPGQFGGESTTSNQDWAPFGAGGSTKSTRAKHRYLVPKTPEAYYLEGPLDGYEEYLKHSRGLKLPGIGPALRPLGMGLGSRISHSLYKRDSQTNGIDIPDEALWKVSGIDPRSLSEDKRFALLMKVLGDLASFCGFVRSFVEDEAYGIGGHVLLPAVQYQYREGWCTLHRALEAEETDSDDSQASNNVSCNPTFAGDSECEYDIAAPLQDATHEEIDHNQFHLEEYTKDTDMTLREGPQAELENPPSLYAPNDTGSPAPPTEEDNVLTSDTVPPTEQTHQLNPNEQPFSNARSILPSTRTSTISSPTATVITSTLKPTSRRLISPSDIRSTGVSSGFETIRTKTRSISTTTA